MISEFLSVSTSLSTQIGSTPISFLRPSLPSSQFMGKSLSSTKTRLQQLSRIVSSDLPNPTKPFPQSRVYGARKDKAEEGRLGQSVPEKRRMEEGGDGGGGGAQREGRCVPLSVVVGDCVKRWFQDTLKEAKSGDVSMQVLVGQMYYSGYGVSRNAQKGRIWITRASKCRSSAWKVSEKRPGYNVSDSDSDELQHES